MAIAPINPRASAALARRELPSADGQFLCALNEAPAPAPVTRSAAASAVHPLLLHQLGAEEAARRDREGRRRGEAMLAALSRLQMSLLEPPDAAREPTDLAALGETCPCVSDPALAGVLRSIRVRLAVEIARRTP